MSEISWPTYAPSAGTETAAGLASDPEPEIAPPVAVGPEPTVAEDYHCYFM